MKKAFTLIEVNLAIMVMAVGVLSIISLYSLGYREERQSREDVAAAAYADAVMGPLVTALSATNVTWDTFRKLKCQPGDDQMNGGETNTRMGWYHYYQDVGGGRIVSDPEALARQAYSKVISELKLPGFPTGWPVSGTKAGDLKGALVVMHAENDAVVTIAFRATSKPDMLMSAPLYYTEVRFQGVVDKTENGK